MVHCLPNSLRVARSLSFHTRTNASRLVSLSESARVEADARRRPECPLVSRLCTLEARPVHHSLSVCVVSHPQDAAPVNVVLCYCGTAHHVSVEMCLRSTRLQPSVFRFRCLIFIGQ